MISLLQIDTPTWLTNYIHKKFEKAYKEILDTHTKKKKKTKTKLKHFLGWAPNA